MRSLLALLVIPVGVFAQTPPAPGAPLEFPADATVPTEGELRALLTGKVMRGKPTRPPRGHRVQGKRLRVPQCGELC